MLPIKIRLFASKLDSPCWIWLGPIKNPFGNHPYGRLHNYYGTGKHGLAHRIVYESLMNIKLETKDNLHHLCENTICVNPTHLEKLSKAEHGFVHRGFPNGMCPKHPSSVVNTYTYSGKKFRICRECNTNRKREWRNANRAFN